MTKGWNNKNPDKNFQMKSNNKEETNDKFFPSFTALPTFRTYLHWPWATVSNTVLPKGTSSSKWANVTSWQSKIRMSFPLIVPLFLKTSPETFTSMEYFLTWRQLSFLKPEASINNGCKTWSKHGIRLSSGKCSSSLWHVNFVKKSNFTTNSFNSETPSSKKSHCSCTPSLRLFNGTN